MEKSKQMTVAIKSQIVTLYEGKKSLREISRRIGYSEGAVRKFLKKFSVDSDLQRKSGSGRPRVTSSREDRILKTLILKDRLKTAAELCNDLQSISGSSISSRTIQRRLVEQGFKSCKPAKKPLLTAAMKKKRLDWAKEHKDWTVNDWRRVIFSDESKFNMIGSDGKQTIRRRRGERFRPDCVIRTVKHSPYIMIWGCMSAFGLGELNFVQGTMDAKKYKIVLENFAIPTIEEITQHVTDPIFQDDSAPCHRARVVS
jgi:transposase